MSVGFQRHAPAALPPGKAQYPFYRGLGGPQGRSGRVGYISPPPGVEPRICSPQLVALYVHTYSVSSKGTGNFWGVKGRESGTDHSTPSSAGLKNEGSVPPLEMQTQAHIRTDVRSPVDTSGEQQSRYSTHPSLPTLFPLRPLVKPQIKDGGRGRGLFLESVTHFSSGQSHLLFPPGAAVTCLTQLLLESQRPLQRIQSPQYERSTFFRNVGSFNHYTVRKP
jgi:hypothetical protein